MAHVTITGDPKRLERLLDYVRGSQFEADTSAVLGAAALKQVQDGFNASRDPYGDRWQPLRYRRGKPLQKSGRLYRSAATQPLPRGGTEVGLTASYAGYHQDGAPPRARKDGSRRSESPKGGPSGIQARPMVPDDDRGLPDKWGRALDTAIEDLIDRKERSI